MSNNGKSLPEFRHLESLRSQTPDKNTKRRQLQKRKPESTGENKENPHQLPQVDLSKKTLASNTHHPNVTVRKRQRSVLSNATNSQSSTTEDNEQFSIAAKRKKFLEKKDSPGLAYGFGCNSRNWLSEDKVEKIRQPIQVRNTDEIRSIVACKDDTFIVRENTLQQMRYGKLEEVQVQGRVKKVTGGTAHFIVTENGQLWSWGDNQYGQAGQRIGSFIEVPTQVNLQGKLVADVESCDTAAGCVTTDGTGFVWGLLNGRPVVRRVVQDSTVQELPLSSKIDQIVFGNSHILVLSRQDDAVWSKGENGHGQLGHGTRRAENQFRRIVSLSRKRVVKLACGGHTSAALTFDGKVLTWGMWNGTEILLPKIVQKIDNVIDIAVGCGHILALTSENKLFAWGWNNSCQCGIDTDNGELAEPMLVEGLENLEILQITAGRAHSTIKCKPLNIT